MAYDVNSLITEIRLKAKDPSFSETLITSYLQDTQDQVLSRSRFPFMEVSITPTLTTSSVDYTPPTDVDVILWLSLKDPATNAITTPNSRPYDTFSKYHLNPALAVASVPNDFTMFGGKVLWDAPLDKAYVLNLKYLKKSAQLTSSSVVPDVPVGYKQILVRGALSGIEEYRENFDIAAVHQRKVEELTEDMLTRLSLRQLVTPHKAKFGGR